MPGRSNRLRWLMGMAPTERRLVHSVLDDKERGQLANHWKLWARPEQLPPAGKWRVWLICAGRGFGKTRTGAEWVRWIARHNPHARIALVGASLAEVRSVMVEGESGLLNCHPATRRPHFEPSLRRITFASGAQATLFSAGEPDSLRGAQHSHAWCDEIAKWDNSSDRAIHTWDNLMMGLRLGEHPRVLATTTPRAVPLMQKLMGDAELGRLVLTRGSTYDNADNLPSEFVAAMQQDYGATALGRQELAGEILRDVEGALWNRALLERCREGALPQTLQTRIVVGVDPPASARGDACGIVVAGIDAHGIATVLADASIPKPSPEAWARRVAETAAAWSADRVVAEANQGGAMVESVLRAADVALPVKLVHASRGKVARAEPVAALYEAGRVRHAGLFASLEDELCGLMAGGDYRGPGRSPDRADALVWALSELMLTRRAVPRVMQV